MSSPTTFTPEISHDEQVQITRLCARLCFMLLQYGAESTLVDQLTHRLGSSLGMDSIETALTPNAIVITSRYHHHCITTTRKCYEKAINMHVVTQLQRLVIDVEQGQYTRQTMQDLENRLHAIRPVTHHPWLVLLMVSLGCACFARLAGAGWLAFGVTFVAAAVGMKVRQIMSGWHFNAILVFGFAAFCTSIVAGFAGRLGWITGADEQITLASSVLFLIPGYPLINSMADILKGHINMGFSRWIIATVLTFGACVGIVFALQLLHLSWTI